MSIELTKEQAQKLEHQISRVIAMAMLCRPKPVEGLWRLADDTIEAMEFAIDKFNLSPSVVNRNIWNLIKELDPNFHAQLLEEGITEDMFVKKPH